jgi:uncharacterized protein (DUF983 family)
MMPAKTSWKRGDPVRTVIARCCTECGMVELRCDRTVQKRIRWRVCSSCGHYMRHVSDDLECKAFVTAIA